MLATCGALSFLGIHSATLFYFNTLSTSDSYRSISIRGLIPLSGGEYVYFMDGLSSLHPFWGPLPAFLYSWISALLLNPTSGAATCLGCASYTVYPILNALGYCLEESTEQALLKITAILYVGRYYMNIHHIQHQIGNLVNYLFHRINDRSEFVQRRVDFGC